MVSKFFFFLLLLNTSLSFSADFFTPTEDLKRLKKEKIPHDAKLPNVHLIGDSISIAYTPFVKGLMKGKANVTRIKGNAGSTIAGIKKGWLEDKPYDVIHFNFGLHDLCYRHPEAKVYGKRDKVRGTLSVTLADYEKNLEGIVARLKKTGATLVWASTTLVPEGEAGRIVGDDVKYNKVAAKVMKKHHIQINDLHALTATFDKSLFSKPGDVHFSAEGSLKLAKQVVSEIEKALK